MDLGKWPLNNDGRCYFLGVLEASLTEWAHDSASLTSRKKWARALVADCVRSSVEWQEREAVARRSASDQPPLV